MYALSRSLYRELLPLMSSSPSSQHNRGDRQFLLSACEEAMRRLLEPDAYADPGRSLFRQVRHLFPLQSQLETLRIVRLHVDAGRLLGDRFESDLKRDCRAFTRKGTPCRREARPGRRYCPSHRHLDETVPQAS